jgi:hypothetical protein
MNPAYFLTEPVEDGYSFWCIRIPEKDLGNGNIHNNFILAQFSIHLPNAEQEARSLLDRLNNS